MSRNLDDLSKALARGISRREAIRRAGAGLVGVVLAGMGAKSAKAFPNECAIICAQGPGVGPAAAACRQTCRQAIKQCGSLENACGFFGGFFGGSSDFICCPQERCCFGPEGPVCCPTGSECCFTEEGPVCCPAGQCERDGYYGICGAVESA
jgi:hypothetical protein